MLVIFYQMIRSGACYAELRGDFFDRLEPERLSRYYVKRSNALVTRSRSKASRPDENFRSRGKSRRDTLPVAGVFLASQSALPSATRMWYAGFRKMVRSYSMRD